MKLDGTELVGLLIATSFAAGLNAYATVATLGLLAHGGILSLPPGLQLLSSWWVIGASTVLFSIEFFADKIPAFDLLWNAAHTFVRVPVAALIAYRATSQLSPEKQLLATLVGGAIALAAHGGKTAARASITPSPEPVSNISLSMGEDVVAIFLVWFASQHPVVASVIVLILVAMIVVVIRWVVRALQSLFRGAGREAADLQART
ncbi:MAG: DUF4126 domain-containing protein [Acidobacteria bacterium]|jgi:uncharacterized protein DUF4126|nr:MAG: DUF4126 domain-containing protein [Acidobacteriota bacterium]